ncbi:MAG: hypothetical protein IJ218_05250 [Alphaproteobacteria bacterium]|nr:hypothetical protein [Alphaproteobacteria bacterium]
MKYKEKHAHQLFRNSQKILNTLAISAALAIPTACTDSPKEKITKENNIGLLDTSPMPSRDKYNETVTLFPVNVPVYNKDGSRKEAQYILTRGLKNSEYTSPNQERSIKKAYINGAQTPSYIEVDANNAVLTEQGFAGLFVEDDGKVIVIADSRVTDFLKERESQRGVTRHNSIFSRSEKTLNTESATTISDSVKNNVLADSMQTKTILSLTDSLRDYRHTVDTDKIQNDTVKSLHTNTRE